MLSGEVRPCHSLDLGLSQVLSKSKGAKSSKGKATKDFSKVKNKAGGPAFDMFSVGKGGRASLLITLCLRANDGK